MKDEDLIAMTINIGGELIRLQVKFDEQNRVRDAEREVKLFIDRLKKNWNEFSDRKLLAMAAYQFASWYMQLLGQNQNAIDLINTNLRKLDKLDNNEASPLDS